MHLYNGAPFHGAVFNGAPFNGTSYDDVQIRRVFSSVQDLPEQLDAPRVHHLRCAHHLRPCGVVEGSSARVEEDVAASRGAKQR